MFGSSMLDIAIGIVFIFLLMSVIATAVNEIILSAMNLRGKYLLKGITVLLNEDAAGKALNLVKQVYNHGQVCGLYEGDFDPSNRGVLPAYIPSRNFALALLGVLEETGEALGSQATPAAETAPASSSSMKACTAIPQTVRRAAASLAKTTPKVGRPLQAMIVMAAGDCTRFQKAIEDWYNSGMDRVSGWYKYRTQWCLFFIGLVMAVTLNANTIHIVRQISLDPTMRQAIVAAAQNAKPVPGSASAGISDQVSQARDSFAHVTELGIPLGWPDGFRKGLSFEAVLGWLLTAIAVSLGAPFWFDMLNKIMVIRSTVKPAEKSQDEASKDKTDKTGPQPA